MVKKLPKGISDYEKLIEENCYYVDKTDYIEKLENLSDYHIMFLRPRKFGKTLFTSVLENYYDILKKDKFETLFGETYIGKNPTKLKNTYHILRFNFSGIDTTSEESTIKGFKNEVISSINLFIQKYKMDFYINKEDEAENVLNNLIKAFMLQRVNEKIYVIIDEYDHFANELLGFHPEQFRALVSKNGKVRKWYEILKKGTESVIDRIFMTGVAPITLDSLTSGFNISKDITQSPKFNEMMGFTKEELIKLMEAQNISKEEQEVLLPIMKENYDGYGFSIDSTTRMYNSNMCLNFLDDYLELGKIPNQLVDVNIASDYKKLGNMLNLCVGENKVDIIENTIAGEGILENITEKFNPAMDFREKEMVSMLFYLGYLTIEKKELGYPKLVIPNKVMKDLYAEFFLEIMQIEAGVLISKSFAEIEKQIVLEGKIEKMVDVIAEQLNHLSNRDFTRFDEKYIKIFFFCIAMNFLNYKVKSEMEVQRKYPDLVFIAKEPEYFSIMIEFKYLKKEEASRLEEKQAEAKKQIQEYGEMEEIKAIPKLRKYTIVAVNDKLYVEEI